MYHSGEAPFIISCCKDSIFSLIMQIIHVLFGDSKYYPYLCIVFHGIRLKVKKISGSSVSPFFMPHNKTSPSLHVENSHGAIAR